jgi:hypothetical protein
MANLRDFKNKNTVFTGTDGIIIPNGDTDGRTGTSTGKFRYNTTTGLGELYTINGWVPIDTPPTVTTISGTINTDTDSTLTINGTNFKSGSIVSIEGAGVGGTPRTLVTTFVNAGQLTAATNAAVVNFTSNALFNVKVTNPSGLAALLENAGTIDRDPVWSTSVGNLGTIYDSERGTKTFTVVATDPDGTSVTYSLVSGSLPSNMSLNTSTGAITGTPTGVGSDTTSSFTIRATSNNFSADRSFNIIVAAPVTVAFAYTGDTQSWSKPSGLTRATVKTWGAAGGAGTSYFNTYGGPGGYGSAIVNLTSISSLNVVVGQGGRASSGERSTYGHLLNSTDGRPGGFGASSGDGGGLSGVFNGAVTSQGNAVLIAGGGGGSGQVTPSRIEGAGGAGGGPNQNGVSGYDNSSSTTAFGRGGTTSAGGQSGIRFYVSPNGVASSSVATDGSALCGGHCHTSSSWTEGGGGGSGYFGGGSGAHEVDGGFWAAGAGGSGYANTGICSSIVAYTGTYESQNANATSDSDWASGISVPNAGTTGGNGRVVIKY